MILLTVLLQSKYVEAISTLEELLKIKKVNFGTTSKEVTNLLPLTFHSVHAFLQTAV